jgi:hypothetical protein
MLSGTGLPIDVSWRVLTPVLYAALFAADLEGLIPAVGRARSDGAGDLGKLGSRLGAVYATISSHEPLRTHACDRDRERHWRSPG